MAIFSAGRVVVTNRMGIISDHQGHRTALLISGVFFCIGAALWANVQFMGPLVLLFIAQFVLGMGTVRISLRVFVKCMQIWLQYNIEIFLICSTLCDYSFFDFH